MQFVSFFVQKPLEFVDMGTLNRRYFRGSDHFRRQTVLSEEMLAQQNAINADALYRRISWRLIPYMFMLYIVAYLDRVNVGFAAVDMRRDLALSASAYGLGAGIFFIGSSCFDLPSNLLMTKFGARKWIARIMISWGIVSSCMVFVKGPWSFGGMRFLLGVAEAGYFPGMVLYLTYWFPSQQRARAVARFMTATAIAGVVGGPLSSALLKLNGHGGLKGWQWLFLAEGLPTILLGISVLFVLKDKPEQAQWLSSDEKTWLCEELERDREESGSGGKSSLGDALKTPAVWLLAVIFFANQICIYIVNLWMPLILSNLEHADAKSSIIARYATMPYVAATIAMVVIGFTSDRMKERRFHMAGCMVMAAAGLAWAANTSSIPVAICAFSLAAAGLWSIMGPFWALPTSLLRGTAAASGIAIITTVGNTGGFLGPFATGKLKDMTHTFTAGLYAACALALVGAALSLAVKSRTDNA